MLILIADIDKNNGIGFKNKIPWNVPENLKFFKNVTADHPVIVGSTTYKTISKSPLCGKHNLVVSRTETFPGTISVTSVGSAMYLASMIDNIYFVIGGQYIYEKTIDYADKLLITHVAGEYETNKFFPRIEPAEWEINDVIIDLDKYKIVQYVRTSNKKRKSISYMTDSCT